MQDNTHFFALEGKKIKHFWKNVLKICWFWFFDPSWKMLILFLSPKWIELFFQSFRSLWTHGGRTIHWVSHSDRISSISKKRFEVLFSVFQRKGSSKKDAECTNLVVSLKLLPFRSDWWGNDVRNIQGVWYGYVGFFLGKKDVYIVCNGAELVKWWIFF